MIQDYDICVSSECTIYPKVYKLLRESQNHSKANCQTMELADIILQSTIKDELSQISLDVLIREAD